MPKWMKPTLLAVLVFVGLYTCASARADSAVEFGYGLGVLNTEPYKTQFVSYVHNRRWYAEYERVGGRKNDMTHGNMYTLGHRVNVPWGKTIPYLGLGLSYGDKLQEHDKKTGRYLVNEKLTFSLKAGIEYPLSDDHAISLSWGHNSTGGRSKPNSGVDRVRLSYIWSF